MKYVGAMSRVPVVPLWTVLARGTTAMMKYHGQSKLVTQGFIRLPAPHQSLPVKEVGTGTHTGLNLEAGMGAEVVKGSCLLA